MKQITATDQELQALVNLLHRACLQGGLEAANPAAVWQQKINAAEEVGEELPANIKPIQNKKDNSSGKAIQPK